MPVKWNREFFAVGLTGSIGSGKSKAAAVFQSEGCIVVDADLVAREVLESAEIKPELISLFGKEIYADGEKPDREKIANAVFENESMLKKLNEIIHPIVARKRKESFEALKPGDVFVYDVPLLFEGNLQNEFDLTILIYAEDQIRRSRVMARSNLSKEQFEKRDRSQMPQAEKRKLADITIENSGTIVELNQSIQNLISQIRSGENK